MSQQLLNDPSQRMFRFDDVSINSRMEETEWMTEHFLERFPDSVVLWGISPLVHDMTGEEGKHKERIYPRILNVSNDHRDFYHVDELGLPENRFAEDGRVILAAHGIVHVDHRLLTKEAQEMSILLSTQLIKSSVFIPPFNHWNKDTETICNEYGIKLVKFEEGWLSIEHNPFTPDHMKWYLHARELTRDDLRGWFDAY